MRLGQPAFRRESVDSTMAWARAVVEAGTAGPGAVFVAAEQTAGRGRHGRTWISPPGRGLYVTAVLPAALRSPSVTLAAALGVAEAAEDRWGVLARVKWPNDLVAGGRKWGGVLAETAPAGPEEDVVLLGIGLNLGQDERELAAVGTPAVSLALLIGAAPTAEAALSVVLEGLERTLAEFQRGGFGALAERWRRRSEIAVGDVVEVDEAGARRQAVCAGFDGEGRMLLEGDPRPLSSATVVRVRARSAA